MLGLPKCCDRLGITSCTCQGRVRMPCMVCRKCRVFRVRDNSTPSTHLVLGKEAVADARHSHEYHLGDQRLVLHTAVSKAQEDEERLADDNVCSN